MAPTIAHSKASLISSPKCRTGRATPRLRSVPSQTPPACPAFHKIPVPQPRPPSRRPYASRTTHPLRHKPSPYISTLITLPRTPTPPFASHHPSHARAMPGSPRITPHTRLTDLPPELLSRILSQHLAPLTAPPRLLSPHAHCPHRRQKSLSPHADARHLALLNHTLATAVSLALKDHLHPLVHCDVLHKAPFAPLLIASQTLTHYALPTPCVCTDRDPLRAPSYPAALHALARLTLPHLSHLDLSALPTPAAAQVAPALRNVAGTLRSLTIPDDPALEPALRAGRLPALTALVICTRPGSPATTGRLLAALAVSSPPLGHLTLPYAPGRLSEGVADLLHNVTHLELQGPPTEAPHTLENLLPMIPSLRSLRVDALMPEDLHGLESFCPLLASLTLAAADFRPSPPEALGVVRRALPAVRLALCAEGMTARDVPRLLRLRAQLRSADIQLHPSSFGLLYDLCMHSRDSLVALSVHCARAPDAPTGEPTDVWGSFAAAVGSARGLRDLALTADYGLPMGLCATRLVPRLADCLSAMGRQARRVRVDMACAMSNSWADCLLELRAHCVMLRAVRTCNPLLQELSFTLGMSLDVMNSPLVTREERLWAGFAALVRELRGVERSCVELADAGCGAGIARKFLEWENAQGAL